MGDLGANRDFAYFQAAMPFLNSFCRLQIRRQNSGAMGGKVAEAFGDTAFVLADCP